MSEFAQLVKTFIVELQMRGIKPPIALTLHQDVFDTLLAQSLQMRRFQGVEFTIDTSSIEHMIIEGVHIWRGTGPVFLKKGPEL